MESIMTALTDILTLYPSLQGKVVNYINPPEYQYRDIPLSMSECFEASLLKSGEYPVDHAGIIAKTIVGYLYLPIILDTMDDEERKSFKMTAEPSLAEFLRDNKLHRARIAQIPAILDSFDEIVLASEHRLLLATQCAEIASVVAPDGKYLSWTSAERAEFVNDIVVPFVLEVCNSYIDYINAT